MQYIIEYAAKGGMPDDYLKQCCYELLDMHPIKSDNGQLREDYDKIMACVSLDRELGEDGLTAKLRKWIEEQDGTFKQRESYEIETEHNKYNIQKERAKIRAILNRMANNRDMIEKTGRGCYRKIDNAIDCINPYSSSGEGLDIQFPLDIHLGVITMSKNIVIVGGEKDAGKTAFMMETARLNKDNWPIRYNSSEMGAFELRRRLDMFEKTLHIPITDWQSVEWIDRGRDFHDIILPDAINIIDYLELSDEFYRVGAKIRAIYDRLGKGVALIALQKKEGVRNPRGAEFALEKARLYISLSRNPPEGNIAMIEHAKNWRMPDRNPNGKQCVFKLIGGCKFDRLTRWEYPPKRGK